MVDLENGNDKNFAPHPPTNPNPPPHGVPSQQPNYPTINDQMIEIISGTVMPPAPLWLPQCFHHCRSLLNRLEVDLLYCKHNWTVSWGYWNILQRELSYTDKHICPHFISIYSNLISIWSDFVLHIFQSHTLGQQCQQESSRASLSFKLDNCLRFQLWSWLNPKKPSQTKSLRYHMSTRQLENNLAGSISFINYPLVQFSSSLWYNV